MTNPLTKAVQQLRAERLRRGLSQPELADLIGIGVSHMASIELCKTNPSWFIFGCWCQALGFAPVVDVERVV